MALHAVCWVVPFTAHGPWLAAHNGLSPNVPVLHGVLCALCWRLALQDILLWGRLGPSAVTHMRSFTPYEFSQTLWAFATVGVPYKVSCTTCSYDLHVAVLAPGLRCEFWL